MDVQNVLARKVFVHKSPVAVLRQRRWECCTSGCSGVVHGKSGMRGQTHKECVCL
jgi:hypothetical protein